MYGQVDGKKVLAQLFDDKVDKTKWKPAEGEYIVFLGKENPTVKREFGILSPTKNVMFVSTVAQSLDLEFDAYSLDRQRVCGYVNISVQIDPAMCPRASRMFNTVVFRDAVSGLSRNHQEIRWEDIRSVLTSSYAILVEDVISRYRLEDLRGRKDEVRKVLESELTNNTSFRDNYGMVVSSPQIHLEDKKTFSEILAESIDRKIVDLEEQVDTSEDEEEKARLEKKIAELKDDRAMKSGLDDALREAQAMLVSEGKTPSQILEELNDSTKVAEAMIKNQQALELQTTLAQLELRNMEMQQKVRDQEYLTRIAEEKARIEALRIENERSQAELDEYIKNNQHIREMEHFKARVDFVSKSTICKQCGYDITQQLKCPRCGKIWKQEAEITESWKCSVCGQANAVSETACKMCGSLRGL